VLTFALLGFLTYRKALNKAGLVPSLILGLAPFLLITIILRYRSIQSALPIVKSIDVTRVLWFADIFFMIPLGLMFDSLAQKRLSFVSARRLLYVAAPLLLAACYVVKSGHNPVELGAYVLSPVFLLLAYCLLVKYRPGQESAWRAFSILLFASVLFPRYDAYETISTFQSHSEETMSYAPVEFAERMEPYYRLATRELPQHLDPRHVRHANIRDHHLKFFLFEKFHKIILCQDRHNQECQQQHGKDPGNVFHGILFIVFISCPGCRFPSKSQLSLSGSR
jgi:hypothetical protein